jgi:hypothetical protein
MKYALLKFKIFQKVKANLPALLFSAKATWAYVHIPLYYIINY